MKKKIMLLSTVMTITMFCAACTNNSAADNGTNKDIQNTATEDTSTQSDAQKAVTQDTSVQNNAQNTTTEAATTQNDALDTVASEGNTQTQDSDPADSEDFYGSWKIVSKAGTSAAYALSEDEINALIGSTITYGSDVYKNGDSEIAITGYEQKTETADDLYNDFRVQLTDLGVTAETIQSVTVNAEGDFVGSTFFPVDSDTLLIYYEGVFFNATRV